MNHAYILVPRFGLNSRSLYHAHDLYMISVIIINYNHKKERISVKFYKYEMFSESKE